MKKINKKILGFGSVVMMTMPIATVLSCGNATQKELTKNDGINIGYWPDIDIAVALGAKIKSAAESSGHFATWFPKGSKYEALIKGLKPNKPLWDDDSMDEEYWRNLNGKGKVVGLTYESWNKQYQKDFLKNDPNIVPIWFDYNAGIAEQEYHWKIEKDEITDSDPQEILIQNKGTKNYQDLSDLWQIRDMGEIVKKAASSLDIAYKTNKYIKKANTIIDVTNDHWNNFRKLQEDNNKALKPFTKEQLAKRDMNSSSVQEDDTRGNSKNDESLLIMNIKTGAVSAGSNNTLSFSTPSMQKEAYTKTHFTMPKLHKSQFDQLIKGNNLNSNGHAVQAGIGSNGIYFPNFNGSSLTQDFWESWRGEIDKLVVGVSHKEINGKVDFYEKFNDETGFGTTGKTLQTLLGSKITRENTIFIDTYLAGSGSYGYRMPIGQNVFIDALSKNFYKEKTPYDWQKRI